MADHVPTDPLREFLSGKRQYERTTLELAVELRRGETRLRGRTIDVSRGGVLIAVTPDEMEIIGGSAEEVLTALVGAFCEGFELHFPGLRLRSAAEMVRLSLPTGGGTGDFFLGCRFTRALSGRQQRKLGIHEAEAADARRS